LNKCNQTSPFPERLNETQTESILFNVRKILDFDSTPKAFVIIVIAVQQGGSAASCNGNMEIIYKDQAIKLSKIREGFKAAGQRRSVRKFARTHATKIALTCAELGIPGNLVMRVKREQPDANIEEKYLCWLSDFQAYNEEAPERVRTAILATFTKKPPLAFAKGKGKEKRIAPNLNIIPTNTLKTNPVFNPKMGNDSRFYILSIQGDSPNARILALPKVVKSAPAVAQHVV
jgi:hypothetical protein